MLQQAPTRPPVTPTSRPPPPTPSPSTSKFAAPKRAKDLAFDAAPGVYSKEEARTAPTETTVKNTGSRGHQPASGCKPPRSCHGQHFSGKDGGCDMLCPAAFVVRSRRGAVDMSTINTTASARRRAPTARRHRQTTTANHPTPTPDERAPDPCTWALGS